MSDLVLSYAQAATAGPTVAGGKGWSLARLDRYGYRVPRGGIVSAGAYRALMSAPALTTLRAILRDVSAEGVADPAALAQLDAMRAAILTAPLPADTVAAIGALLTAASLDDTPVAVRSSATAEDGATTSFAGIHQSFLQVRGLDAVVEAIKGCYASLWTPQALAYRRRAGLDDEDVTCAVLICAMVTGPEGGEPPQAGVAFSCDPRTGARDRVTISAVRGLGEALVGGRANPEEVTVTMDLGGEPQAVLHTSRADGILTDAHALELARLIWRVQWALGDGQDPQDVEWVHDGERFWLVQARPVTRLPWPTFPAIAHLPIMWSNANLKDNLPGVASPLGWGYLGAAVARATSGDQKLPSEPEGREAIRRFSGRPYMDMTAVQWALYDGLGMSPQQVTQGIGGHQPQIPVPPGSPFRGKDGRRRLRALLKMVPNTIRTAWTAQRDTARLREQAARLRAVDVRSLTNAELIAHGEQAQAVFGECVRKFLFNAFGIWDTVLAGLIERYRPGRGKALAAGLMAGSDRVTSAEHGYRLYDLARLAADEPQARHSLETEPLDPWGWRNLPDDSPFRGAFAAYLDEFGHRGISELDIANPRWVEDPTYLLGEIGALLREDRSRSPRDAAHAVRQAAEIEVRALPLPVRPLVRWLAARARAGAAKREAGKSIISLVTLSLRAIALEVGARLVAAGMLDDPSDVIYLAYVDFMAYLRGEWDGHGAAALAVDRRAQRDRWLTESLPDLLILDAEGRPATMPELPAPPARTRQRRSRRVQPAPSTSGPDSDEVLGGTPAAPGHATGRARVIRDPHDGWQLQPGEILVAPSTDPGWTPLFLRAAAIVMEVGGYHSHGAIVAREYGIPAVVNVPGLLRRIADGQLIAVDGDAGQVTLDVATAEVAPDAVRHHAVY